MTKREFLDGISNHTTLHWAEGGPRDDRIYVVCLPGDGVKLKWEIDPADILSHSWAIVEQVLIGARSPKIIRNITRIVGYYSYEDHWNKSKIAELNDRRKGEYVVPELVAA
jgi:hypothetical protein